MSLVETVSTLDNGSLAEKHLRKEHMLSTHYQRGGSCGNNQCGFPTWPTCWWWPLKSSKRTRGPLSLLSYFRQAAKILKQPSRLWIPIMRTVHTSIDNLFKGQCPLLLIEASSWKDQPVSHCNVIRLASLQIPRDSSQYWYPPRGG